MLKLGDLHPVAQAFLMKLRFKEIPFSITGSRAFGLESRDSDLDVIIDIKHTKEARRIIEDVFKSEIKQSDYNNGWAFRLDKLSYSINLIRLHPNELPHWENATKWLTYMVDTSPKHKQILFNKDRRYGIFEHLVALSRMLSSMEGYVL